MQKKILLLTNSTWNVHNFRVPLIKKLKADYEIVVVAPVDEYIHYLNHHHFTKHIQLKHLKAQSKNPFQDLKLLAELYKIFKTEKPDLILSYTIKPNIYGNIAARLLGIPVISTLTGLGYSFINKGFSNNIVKPLYKFALQKTKQIIFHNGTDKKLFEKQKLTNPKRNLVIQGSGVNTNYFRPLAMPMKEKFIFLFVGRLLEDKGIREFVEAAKKVKQIAKNIEFWVVGQLNAKNPAAISEETLLQWVDQKHIKYLGTANDIRPYMKMADCFVLPSYREGMPRAILEAMSMGKPIVTTQTAGCEDTVVEGENGFLVPIRNAEQLAKSLLKMYYLSQEEQEELGAKSRELALEKFDDRIIVSQYRELVEALLQPEKDVQPQRKGQKVL